MTEHYIERSPDITVLMAVLNGEKYLESAAHSILNQSFKNFEFIIVDDGSTDRTPKILESLSAQDPRVKVVTLETNQNQPNAINRGLEIASAPLVASMDADDLAYPNRLAVQKKRFDENPDLVMVGGSIDQIDADGAPIRTSYRPRDAEAIRWLMRMHMPFTHPTIMYRRIGPDGTPNKYNADFAYADDYEFCSRVVRQGDAINLPDILLKYRVHGSSLTGKNWDKQISVSKRIGTQFQKDDLPTDIFDAMENFRRFYWDLTIDDAQQQVPLVFKGFRRLIEHDVARSPKHRQWYWRTSSQLIVQALRRGKMTKPDIARAFMAHGRDFLVPLGMRGLEAMRKLPVALRSDNWF